MSLSLCRNDDLVSERLFKWMDSLQLSVVLMFLINVLDLNVISGWNSFSCTSSCRIHKNRDAGGRF